MGAMCRALQYLSVAIALAAGAQLNGDRNKYGAHHQKALVVRAYASMDSGSKRFLRARLERWRHQLGNEWALWLAVDETRGNWSETDINGVLTFRYDESQMAEAFTVLHQLDTLLAQRGEAPTSQWRRWGRVFQTEATLLWWVALGHDDAGALTRVWVTQHDVDYFGDIGAFLDSVDVSSNAADLITDMPIVSSSPDTRQCHPHCECAAWSGIMTVTLFDTDMLHCAMEGIRGYSSTFLETIRNHVTSGVSGWSEYLAPTLCARTPGCRTAHFPLSSMAVHYHWDDMDRDGPLQYEDVDPDADRWKGQWVHFNPGFRQVDRPRAAAGLHTVLAIVPGLALTAWVTMRACSRRSVRIGKLWRR